MKSIVVVVVSDDLPLTCAEGAAAEVATCLCEVVTGRSCRSLMVCEADVSGVTVFCDHCNLFMPAQSRINVECSCKVSIWWVTYSMYCK